MSVHLTATGRLQVIERIMEARFKIVAVEEIRSRDLARRAAKARGAAGRGGLAVRERERLIDASDSQLCAELAELC